MTGPRSCRRASRPRRRPCLRATRGRGSEFRCRCTVCAGTVVMMRRDGRRHRSVGQPKIESHTDTCPRRAPPRAESVLPQRGSEWRRGRRQETRDDGSHVRKCSIPRRGRRRCFRCSRPCQAAGERRSLRAGGARRRSDRGRRGRARGGGRGGQRCPGHRQGHWGKSQSRAERT